MRQERRADLQVACAEQVPSERERVGECSRGVLHVDQERRQVVCEVVAERDRDDRDDVVAVTGPGAATVVCERAAETHRDCIRGSKRDRGGEEAEGVDTHQACAPRVLERVLSGERDPPERARQPVEGDRCECDEDERDSARGRATAPTRARHGIPRRNSRRGPGCSGASHDTMRKNTENASPRSSQRSSP